MNNIVGVGIDWGSSNLRAWAFDTKGTAVRETKRTIGLREARERGFATVFADLNAQWDFAKSAPVVACGMIGAKDGWVEAPYLPCPTTSDSIQIAALHVSEINLWILPGLSNAGPSPDVMRGEETQICGAIAAGHTGLFCLPGTHSKWAEIEANQITGFRTFVSGELFALSKTSSVWGQFTEEGPLDAKAFRSGLLAAENSPILNTLFQARSRVLAGELSRSQSTWFLSGCLIGSEVMSANPDKRRTTLLADGQLAELYKMAFIDLVIPYTSISSETCTTSALFRALLKITRDRHDL